MFKESENAEKAVRIAREGNLTSIITPKTTYHIGYNIHTQGSLKIKDTSRAIFIEGGVLPYPTYHEEFQKAFNFVPQSDALNFAAENNLPVYATDCSISYTFVLAETLLQSAEGIGAVYLAGKMQEAVSSNQHISRRGFIRGLGYGLVAFAALPLLATAGRGLTIATNIAPNESTELSKLSQQTHPELKIILLRLRNLIMAQKLKYIASTQKLSETYSVLGAGHVVIEDYILASTEQRMNELRKIQPLMQFLPMPETIYSIYKYKAVNGNWTLIQISEEPNLKTLVS